MRFPCVSIGLIAVVCFGVSAVSIAEETPSTGKPLDGAALMRSAQETSRWLSLVKSFHLRGKLRDERGPEGIAKGLRELKKQFRDLDNPNPLQFPELLPVSEVSFQDDFDRTRISTRWKQSTPQGDKLSNEVRIWDGKRALTHSQYFQNKQDGFALDPTPKDRVSNSLFMWVSAIRKQPPVFWWRNSPEAQKNFETYFGNPEDFVLVGREDFHGTDCHVLLSSRGNQSDRYYFGIQDRRWYGAKEGIIAIQDLKTFEAKHLAALEEFSGKKITTEASKSPEYQTFVSSLRSLPQDKKELWCRILYKHVSKDYSPVFEYWYADYRDLGEEKLFPFSETFLFYSHELKENSEGKIFVQTKRTLTIDEVTIDQPLDERLFVEPLTEGTTILDSIHRPRLIYKHKAKFTPEEWDAIVNKAEKEVAEESVSEKRVEALIGTSAPPLPAGVWINSKPLTWVDLKGRIVYLKFWGIGCGPCYSELSSLEAPIQNGSPKEGDDSSIIIGVHLAGNSKDEVEAVVRKQKLQAPICIDQDLSGSAPWGDFFEKCAVNHMPLTVAVDENGKILGHGSPSDVLPKVQLHRAKTATSK